MLSKTTSKDSYTKFEESVIFGTIGKFTKVEKEFMLCLYNQAYIGYLVNFLLRHKDVDNDTWFNLYSNVIQYTIKERLEKCLR